MSDWFSDSIRSSGYFGILLLMFVENIFPPIPSELIMPLAGYLVAKDQLDLLGVILSGSAGAAAGAIGLYYVGYLVGEKKIEQWSHKYGRWFVIQPRDLERNQRLFERHGAATVFYFRLVPGMRSLISIPAGISKMPMLRFSFFTLLGTLIWSTILAVAGYFLGSQFSQVKEYVGPVSTAMVAILVLWYLWRVIRWPHQQRKADTA